MKTYLLDRLLALSVTLIVIGLFFYRATWYFYNPPPCAPGSTYAIECNTSSVEIQQYWDSLARPDFGWWSVVIMLGLVVALSELRAHLVPVVR